MAKRDRSQIPVLPARFDLRAAVCHRRPEPIRLLRMILFLAFLLYMDRALTGPFGMNAVERGMPLPNQVGAWKLSEGPRRIEPKTIFDYMNGGGELYLGYRFRYLDVYDYRDPADTQILLEIYQMETSDDAFGLLSLDSDGQVVQFGSGDTPAGRGIYGAGLLRLWSGDVFVRILAEQETPESRDAIMELAGAVTKGRTLGSRPAFIDALPSEFSGYQLNHSQVSYFRSYLVLNSIYFLSTQNILNLDLKTEAIVALYRRIGADTPNSARLLEIRYETPGLALAAYRSFMQSYLPEHKCQTAAKPSGGSGGQPDGACLVEDGWIGYRVVGRNLVLAFQFPSEQVARLCLDEAAEQLNNWEKSHE